MRIARRLLLPSLTSKPSWIPFYEQSRIDKCVIIFKLLDGTLLSYLNDHIIINNNRHARNTCYANINIICPKYRRETEGGRAFSVYLRRNYGTVSRNSVPLDIRKADSLPYFKNNLISTVFKGQQLLHHVNIYNKVVL